MRTPMVSDDEKFLRRYIAQLKAERLLWERMEPLSFSHAIRVPHLLPALQDKTALWVELTADQIADVLEQINDLISYCEHDLTRVSKPEGNA